MMKEQLL